MDFSNTGDSVYHRYQAIYSRVPLDDPSASLVYCTGPGQSIVEKFWLDLYHQLPLARERYYKGSEASSSLVTLSTDADSLESNTDRATVKPMRIYELQRPSEGCIVGLVVNAETSGEGNGDAASAPAQFESQFATMVLSQVFLPTAKLPIGTADVTDAIVQLFDERLRYDIGDDDQWAAGGGRPYFRERVAHFTARGARLEFCLPAFPCKSSNPDKVAGTAPDQGEALALQNLHGFVEAVEALYAPGAKVWIISDGHVFSDCIGVDDEAVDDYGERLHAMNDAISGGGRSDRVGFKSLVDLFRLDDTKGAALEPLLPSLDHFLGTALTPEAELSRRVLMAGCQSHPDKLRARIDAQEATVLRLYRGFARFMLEDLDRNRYTRDLSRSRRRKLSGQVAFEMIQRNQAYSNLVELVFPCHVRLSIHAHRNNGPKFGIRLFGVDVHATDVLSPAGPAMASTDLLHVPTAWHNCVCVVAPAAAAIKQGPPCVYMTKAKTVRDALAAGAFSGGWVETASASEGGYFMASGSPAEKTPAVAKEDDITTKVNDNTMNEVTLAVAKQDSATTNASATKASDKAYDIRVDPPHAHTHTWSRALLAGFTTLYTRLTKWREIVMHKMGLRGDSV